MLYLLSFSSLTSTKLSPMEKLAVLKTTFEKINEVNLYLLLDTWLSFFKWLFHSCSITVHPFAGSSIHQLIHSFVHSFIHSLFRSFLSFFLSSFPPFFLPILLLHSLPYIHPSFIHSFKHLSIHLSVHINFFLDINITIIRRYMPIGREKKNSFL